MATLSNIDLNADLFFIGKTDEEISLVCLTKGVPELTLERSDGWRDRERSPQDSSLYRPLGKPERERVQLRLIPYFLWANRSPGEMRVWLRLG